MSQAADGLAAAAQLPSALWFRMLFGFKEDADAVAVEFEWQESAGILTSRKTGESFRTGWFSTPSLGELRRIAAEEGLISEDSTAARHNFRGRERLTLEHMATGDAFELHCDPQFAGAMVMCASQFNCLEFPNPDCTPEDGITAYAFDPTQGPACALAAPAATVVRNYFIRLPDGRAGQSADNQLNNLADVLRLLQPGEGQELIVVRNGYTFSEESSLCQLNEHIRQHDREALLAKLRIGVHSRVGIPWETRFRRASPDRQQTLSQTFNSAISCSYSAGSSEAWEPMARIVLDASYEATLWAAAIEAARGDGNGVVLLTSLGGGVFGNKRAWISGAIARACYCLQHLGLRVILCHYRNIDPDFIAEIDEEMQRLAI